MVTAKQVIDGLTKLRQVYPDICVRIVDGRIEARGIESYLVPGGFYSDMQDAGWAQVGNGWVLQCD